MKILYFYRGVPVSTPLMHIRFLIAAFRSQGHTVIECFPAAGKTAVAAAADTAPLARAKGWFRAHMPRLLVNLAQLYEARRARPRLLDMCKSDRPDFIYERYSIFTDAGIRAARQIGCPLIQEVNAVYSEQHSHVFAPGFRSLAQRTDRRLLPQADAIIAVSGEVANALLRVGVPAQKVTVQHNAVSPEEYAGLEERRRTLRESLGLSDSLVVVVLQALDSGPFPAKLIGAVQAIWPLIRRLEPRARILWIGGGSRLQWFREQLQRHVAAAPDDILLLGRKPHSEVPGLLACGDLGLVPWHRPFCSPMKIFEYMASGLPVVAPDLPGISEIIRDGENGLLFPHEDFPRAAEVILRLLANPAIRRDLSQRGRDYVLRNHTWEKNAEQVVEIAERLLARDSSAAGKS